MYYLGQSAAETEEMAQIGRPPQQGSFQVSFQGGVDSWTWPSAQTSEAPQTEGLQGFLQGTPPGGVRSIPGRTCGVILSLLRQVAHTIGDRSRRGREGVVLLTVRGWTYREGDLQLTDYPLYEDGKTVWIHPTRTEIRPELGCRKLYTSHSGWYAHRKLHNSAGLSDLPPDLPGARYHQKVFQHTRRGTARLLAVSSQQQLEVSRQ